jgi:ribosomal protein S1
MNGKPEDSAEDLAPGVEQDESQEFYDFGHLAPLADGEMVEATILQITAEGAIVDFGFKQEGFVPIAQLTGPDGGLL